MNYPHASSCPSELRPQNLTSSELGAMVEHLLYRADWSARRALQERMPDAYQRLGGLPANNGPEDPLALEKRTFK